MLTFKSSVPIRTMRNGDTVVDDKALFKAVTDAKTNRRLSELADNMIETTRPKNRK